MKVSFVVGYTKQYPKMNVTELKKINELDEEQQQLNKKQEAMMKDTFCDLHQ